MAGALLGFAIAATLLILAPGPDTMVVMRNSLRGGRSAGVCTAAGILTGLLSWALAATLGLSSLLAASRVGYDVLRIVGAAYLIWLGTTSLMGRRRSTVNDKGDAHGGSAGDSVADGDARGGTTKAPTLGRGRAYLNGVVSNLFNPKVGAFFVAFLPDFIPTGRSVRELSLLYGCWFTVETGIWLGILVWMVDRGVTWFSRPHIQRRLERITGVVLIGFGIRLATESR